MKTPNIDFMGARKIAAIASGVFLLISLTSLAVNGLNWGLDFTGGSLVEVSYDEPVDAEELRQFLESEGFEDGTVQYFGTQNDILIRMPAQEGLDQSSLGDRILAALRAESPTIEMRQSSFVGPAVGEELAEDGGLALLTALIVVMFYILFRFTKQFAVGAVAALAHDVLIVVGCFSLFQWTVDLTVLAALLAVIGYSLNDTIVVSDRIRENFRKIRKGLPIDVVNQSLNQTLGRTLVTSLTTLFVLLALLLAGGEVIRGFALSLTIGVAVGTYSSIYIAANVLLLMGITREDLLVPQQDDSNPEGSYP
ncbi:MAG: protein translocase subunit SecF [Pseudomonadales bacterium]|nr:protein translocase subunit SecF [Pseudomonadales bacterium]